MKKGPGARLSSHAHFPQRGLSCFLSQFTAPSKSFVAPVCPRMGCCPTVRTALSELLSGGLRAITLLLSVVSNLLSSSTWLQGTADAAMLAVLVLKAASPLYLNAQLPPPTQKAPSSGLLITCLEIQAIRVVRSLRHLDWIKVGLTAFFIQRAGSDSACRTTTGNGARLALLLDTVAPRAGHRFMSLQFLHQGDLGKGSRLLLLSVDR